MTGSFTLREHTADVAVEAIADSLGGVFAAVADGLAAAMCESWPDTGERHHLTVAAENPQAALYDYLDELIYERDVEGVLPVDHEATVVHERAADQAHTIDAESTIDDEWVVEASYRGVPLAEVTARDVKAVTYSDMELEERDDGWYAYVVFDV